MTYDVQGTLTDQKGEGVIQKARVGGFAEFVLVHESQLVKIAADFPMELASLLACGVTTGFGAAVNRAKVPPLSSVVVIVAGGVGLNSVQGAVTCGANPIIAVDILDSKLTRARDFGAIHTVNSKATDAVAAVKDLTGGRGADFVFVTVGSSAALQPAFAMLARRGSAVMVGLPPATDPPVSLPAAEFALTEKTVTGGFMGSICLQVDIPAIIALQVGALQARRANRRPLSLRPHQRGSGIIGGGRSPSQRDRLRVTRMARYEGPVCALCRVAACDAEPGTKSPPGFCPMMAEPELLQEVERTYLADPELQRMAVESARTEAAGYCTATRVEEIMDFARRMGWRRLSIAHCIGLMQEAKAARDMFVVIGLCVGHDSLFFMHSKAPVTVLVAKARVLGDIILWPRCTPVIPSTAG